MALGRILVVEDEAPVREVLTEYFATEGYAVEAATNAGERLETVALAAARDASAGREAAAGEHLAEVAMLLDLAAEFGDLPAADRALVESAIEAARRSLPARH